MKIHSNNRGRRNVTAFFNGFLHVFAHILGIIVKLIVSATILNHCCFHWVKLCEARGQKVKVGRGK